MNRDIAFTEIGELVRAAPGVQIGGRRSGNTGVTAAGSSVARLSDMCGWLVPIQQSGGLWETKHWLSKNWGNR